MSCRFYASLLNWINNKSDASTRCSMQSISYQSVLHHDSSGPLTPTTARPKDPDRPISYADQQAQRQTTSSTAARRRKKELVISVPANLLSGSALSMPSKKEERPSSKPMRPAAPSRQFLSGFPLVDTALRLAGSTLDERLTREFWTSYTEHCQDLFAVMNSARFRYVTASFSHLLGPLLAQSE